MRGGWEIVFHGLDLMKGFEAHGGGRLALHRRMKRQNEPNDPNSAGQSGADQGLPAAAEADSESVKELVEEGQFFEADVVNGVENAPDPDVSEVRTRQVPEDDVPPEYLDQD